MEESYTKVNLKSNLVNLTTTIEHNDRETSRVDLIVSIIVLCA